MSSQFFEFYTFILFYIMFIETLNFTAEFDGCWYHSIGTTIFPYVSKSDLSIDIKKKKSSKFELKNIYIYIYFSEL
jgi:hypothetical protein